MRIGGRVEKTFLARVFADRIGGCSGRDAFIDFGPGGPTIVRAPEVRVEIIEPKGIRGNVGRLRIEVAGLHVEDSSPGFERRRDVIPFRSAVGGDLNQPISSASP